MTTGDLSGQLRDFNAWKQAKLQIMLRLETWLKAEALYTSQVQRALSQAMLTLHRDHITVAVVGEFSRGKTELINALFFSDHNRRLLPTDAGRTTMCPTEIFQDPSEDPYLKLLPIETRLDDASLQELRERDEVWEKIPLDLNDSDKLQETLLKIQDQKLVSREMAANMGLGEVLATVEGEENRVSVPAWRLALLNYRHPLLAQGMRILDTPGLNAVSSEPELTYEILPNAQAHLFVVGADTGITQSDLEMWQQLIQQPGMSRRHSVLVVLNKSDTLWDELRSENEVETTIERQRREVARMLEISSEQVHAVSAQKGLLARVRSDDQMEQRSGIPKLEHKLARTLVDNRQEVIMEQSTGAVVAALNSIEELISSRRRRLKKQIRELQELSSRSEIAIDQLLKQAQQDKQRYQASVTAYKQSRSEFTAHGRILLDALSPARLEDMIRHAHKQMTGAWTTMGLKDAMKELFDEINRQMEVAASQAHEMRRLVRTIYRRFQNRHGMQLSEPTMLSLVSHQVEFNLVYQEAEIFRKSARTTLTEQHFAVKRYFQTVVSRVRKIFLQAHAESKEWLQTALDGLTQEIHEHRNQLAQQLADLKLTGRSRSMVRQRLASLEQDCKKLERQLTALKQNREELAAPPEEGKNESRLRVVSSNTA